METFLRTVYRTLGPRLLYPTYNLLRRLESWYWGVPRTRAVAIITRSRSTTDTNQLEVLLVRHTGHMNWGLPGEDLRPRFVDPNRALRHLLEGIKSELDIRLDPADQIPRSVESPFPEDILEYDELMVFEFMAGPEQNPCTNYEIADFKWLPISRIEATNLDEYAKACLGI